MTRLHLRSPLLVGLVFVLTACGPAAPTSPPAATSAPATAPTTAPAAAATTAPAAGATTAPAAAAKPTTAPAAAPAAALPTDAAPADQQVLVVAYDNTADFTTLDFWESVYKRGGARSDLFTEPLVRINKDFGIVPGAATEWSVDSTGKVWTFKLDPNLMWSDDTPVTADDYVATFRYGADPKHAWDFTWFFNGIIKNWDDAVALAPFLKNEGAIGNRGRRVGVVEAAVRLERLLLKALAVQHHRW